LKKKIAFTAIILVSAAVALSEPLTEQYQRDLFERLYYYRGLGPRPLSLDSNAGIPHCGTPIMFEFFINRGNFTGEYQIQAAKIATRPELALSHISPSGRFKIHYTTEGVDAVYQPGVDTIGGGDGVPDYVNKIGDIADSVYEFEINHLGFPAPPGDGTNGGDSKYDIYVHSLGQAIYGQTNGEVTDDSQSATSYIEINSVYDFYPYVNRPLDAVRVTLAHEFFHAIHFGMDYTEYEGDKADPRLYWWEMSATWMEEMAYDHINDYYGYLSYYLEEPWLGLQFFSYDQHRLHPYGAGLFPIFLTEKFDTSIVRLTWEKCRDYGIGPQFLIAVNSAIDDLSGGEYDLGKAFNEFAVWNLFTGERADRAPQGYRYSEAEFYPIMSQSPSDSIFITHYNYPFILTWGGWPDSMSTFKRRVPQNLAANYINLSSITLIPDSLTFVFHGVKDSAKAISWEATMAAFPINSALPAIIEKCALTPSGNLKAIWNTSGIYNIVAIVSPASTVNSAYPGTYGFGYYVVDSAQVDSTLYALKPPYPNPLKVDLDDDYVTFSADKPLLPKTEADFRVYIFDVAGEKVKDTALSSAESAGESQLVIKWKLDNASGEKVAPGVYLAICKLIYKDGSPEAVQKYKVAVIK
jgi:hypothetical protein